MRGTKGRNIECAAFRVETGIELRTMYSPEEIIASQLFRGPDADEQVAEAADQWRLCFSSQLINAVLLRP